MTTTNPLRQEYENQSAFAMRSCCQHRKQGLTPAKPSSGVFAIFINSSLLRTGSYLRGQSGDNAYWATCPQLREGVNTGFSLVISAFFGRGKFFGGAGEIV
jgi:hypothetical protein